VMLARGIMELGCEPLMDILLNGSKTDSPANVIIPRGVIEKLLAQDPVATDQSDATAWIDDRNSGRLRVMP